jgi:nuclear pore complex protein Nup210
MDWWQQAKLYTPKTLRKGLASAALLTPWLIWKQRNECIFEGAQPSVPNLVARIKDEAAIWARPGAKGLRVVLPSTWDVH